MDKFLHSRFFRCLVCLVLVCCILVNCSPIRAKASVVLTSQAIIALMYLAACGAVIVPTSIELANQLGKSLDDHMKITLPMDSVDLWVILNDYLDSLVPEWDPNKPHDDLAKWLSRGLIAAITAWCCTLIKMDGVEVEEEVEIPEGYASYNGHILPYFELPDNQRAFVLLNGSDYIIYYTDGEPYWHYDGTYNKYFAGTQWRRNQATETSWKYLNTYNSSMGVLSHNSNYLTEVNKLIWANHDIVSPDGIFSIAASCPITTDTQTITIEPDIYVGDLPDQIKNGDTDEEKLNLPPLDPSRLFPGKDPIDVQMKDTLQKLKDGTITPKQFEDMFRKPDTPEPEVTTPVETQPSVDPDPEPSDPPATEPWEPSGMENFTLDLKKFFPFCIPFDLYDFLTCLNAEPEAPVISWQIPVPGGGNSRSGAVPLEIDLSAFDSVAQLLRRLQLLLFCVGLAFKTRDLIKG